MARPVIKTSARKLYLLLTKYLLPTNIKYINHFISNYIISKENMEKCQFTSLKTNKLKITQQGVGVTLPLAA
jgi:hypothetical protein